MKLLIDTDPGVDDALALAYLMSNKNVDIVALTTVAGNATIQKVTQNAYYIRDLLERQDIPIFSGSDRPLKRKQVLAVSHGVDGLSGIKTKRQDLDGKAVEKIIEEVGNNPGMVRILALGPLTNIAKAIVANSKVMSCVKDIVIMGGAFLTEGNQTKYAEFNMYVDPEAASIVAGFPINKTYVPLDVCNQIEIPLEVISSLESKKLRLFFKKITAEYYDRLRAETGASGILAYDLTAAYATLYLNKCQSIEAKIVIDTKSAEKYGRTMLSVPNGPGEASSVIMYADSKDVTRSFIKEIRPK